MSSLASLPSSSLGKSCHLCSAAESHPPTEKGFLDRFTPLAADKYLLTALRSHFPFIQSLSFPLVRLLSGSRCDALIPASFIDVLLDKKQPVLLVNNFYFSDVAESAPAIVALIVDALTRPIEGGFFGERIPCHRLGYAMGLVKEKLHFARIITIEQPSNDPPAIFYGVQSGVTCTPLLKNWFLKFIQGESCEVLNDKYQPQKGTSICLNISTQASSAQTTLEPETILEPKLTRIPMPAEVADSLEQLPVNALIRPEINGAAEDICAVPSSMTILYLCEHVQRQAVESTIGQTTMLPLGLVQIMGNYLGWH